MKESAKVAVRYSPKIRFIQPFSIRKTIHI